jgi:hypothetical protein
MKFRKAEAPDLTTEKARHGASTANFEADLRLPPVLGWSFQIFNSYSPHAV